MSKKISFTISERIKGLVPILNEFKGGLVTLAKIVDDVKKIAVTEEEWKKADKKETVVKNENGKDVTQITWDDAKGGEKEIELEKETLDYLKGAIEKKDEAGEITLADMILVGINKKLK